MYTKLFIIRKSIFVYFRFINKRINEDFFITIPDYVKFFNAKDPYEQFGKHNFFIRDYFNWEIESMIRNTLFCYNKILNKEKYLPELKFYTFLPSRK
jgi:hypothetical protein